jgi:hypothetical protein
MLNYMVQTNQWFANGHSALMAGEEQWAWHKGIDYDIIDGTVSSQVRSKIQAQFNDSTNFRYHYFILNLKQL